jgi:GT2 family glycosyltransferase
MQVIAHLSVAIATYNRLDDLIHCVEELLNGPVIPAEVIIIDQSDDDNNHLIQKQFVKSIIPLKYVHQEQRGLSVSRNTAINLAGYPFIAFTDDDCVPDKNWVEAISKSFLLMPIPDIVCGRVIPYGPKIEGKYAISTRDRLQRSDYQGRTVPWCIGTGGNCAIRTDLFTRIGVFNEQLGAGSPGKAAEDVEFIYRSLIQGVQIRYEPEAVIYHKWQNRERRFRSRWEYGHGIGAFIGIRLRKLDFYIIYILLNWIVSRLVEFGKYLVTGNWTEVQQRLLNLSGTCSGLSYGLSFKPDQREKKCL